MLDLFVWDAATGDKVPAVVVPASQEDLGRTKDWQTDWTSKEVIEMPNKVALHLSEDGELLGLMAYEMIERSMAVEIIYLENARHSNANLLHAEGKERRYAGIAKALFAYAADVSLQAGFDGVLIFKAKTSRLLEYYMQEFGARQVGSYDPFRLVIWEDAAEKIMAEYRREQNGKDRP